MTDAALAPAAPPARPDPGPAEAPRPGRGARTGLRPRVPGRSARLAFAAFAVVYLAGSLAGAFLVSVCPIELRSSEARPALAAARALPRPPDVVSFGSSRFICAVDPRRVAARLAEAGVPGALVLDASVAAADPVAFDAILSALAADGRTPRLAVVELSPEIVSRRSLTLKPQVLRFATLGQLARLDPRDGIAASVQGAVAAILLAPFDRYRGPLLGWLLDGAGPVPRPADREPVAKPPARRGEGTPDPEEGRRARRAIGRWLRNYRPGGLPGEGLTSFLARARQLGTRVVLVGVPVSSRHRAAYTPEVLERYRSWVDGVTRGSGVPYHEMRDLLADGDFFDTHHANGAGAARFSDQLARQVVAPALREAR